MRVNEGLVPVNFNELEINDPLFIEVHTHSLAL
jgi:hypothetical protein